jgi:hypothetical protein
MTKLLSLLVLAMMAAHLIRPLGLPGLKRRKDVWKIAVAAFALISLTVLASHGTASALGQHEGQDVVGPGPVSGLGSVEAVAREARDRIDDRQARGGDGAALGT